jgi:hypothetical protein
VTDLYGMSTEQKPVRVYGPETWETVAGRDWSWWDLWFCVIAVKDHGGDLAPLQSLAGELAHRIRHLDRGMFQSRDSDDARLSHVFDLAERLGAAGLAPADLANPAVLADRKITARARAKFKGSISDGTYARTPPMLDLPRQWLHQRARHGLWSTFAVDPTAFYEKFRPTVDRKRGLSENQTSRVVDTLYGRVARLDRPRGNTAERLALYRGFYTAADELADIADDSYGHLGELRTEMWLVYLDIDWRATGMSPDDYWRDLCGLHMWEDYGMDFEHERAWFRSVQQDEITLIERILSELAEEAVSYVLDYQADKALAAMAQLRSSTSRQSSGPPGRSSERK